MGKKNKKKQSRKSENPKIANEIYKSPLNIKAIKPIESPHHEMTSENNLIYLYFFLAVFTIMLFIFYFIPSIDSFSYLNSFYLANISIFFTISFLFVIFYLLFGYVIFADIFQKYPPFADIFQKKMDWYKDVFQMFYAFIVAVLFVYPVSVGYSTMINEPTIWYIFLVADLIIEIYPFYIVYGIFKGIGLKS